MCGKGVRAANLAALRFFAQRNRKRIAKFLASYPIGCGESIGNALAGKTLASVARHRWQRSDRIFAPHIDNYCAGHDCGFRRRRLGCRHVDASTPEPLIQRGLVPRTLSTAGAFVVRRLLRSTDRRRPAVGCVGLPRRRGRSHNDRRLELFPRPVGIRSLLGRGRYLNRPPLERRSCSVDLR
jgi:hypothetical protein